MMRCEQWPRRCLATNDVESNGGATPKPPPGKDVFSRTINPVRLEPGFDILMTGNGHEALPTPANRLSQGRAANLGHRAIDNACVLIENHAPARRRDRQRQSENDAELLPRGQDG